MFQLSGFYCRGTLKGSLKGTNEVFLLVPLSKGFFSGSFTESFKRIPERNP